jgi:hypothetical protein
MIRIFLLSAGLLFATFSASAQHKAHMRQKFQRMINTHFDSLAILHAEDFAHVLVIDGNVVPLIYTGKFPVTIKAALRRDIPFSQIKFIELIHTDETPRDTLWHSWTKIWTNRLADSTQTSKIKEIEVADAINSYIGVHKLNGKPVNVIAKNLTNPQALKKFIDVAKLRNDEMVVIYYETEHGFYLGYKRL